MYVLLVLVTVGAVFGVALVASGRGAAMSLSESEQPVTLLPDGPVGPADLEALRLPVVFRGYRMDMVEALLDRLAEELRGRDARIAELEAGEAGDEPRG
jgi:DivIVA domain-containing protein